tara:strand:- start:456 stop:1517 length:1062 start_codon:yes stop_codon:yes gene_type:complete
MTRDPTVSVIIPAYRAASLIAETLDSLTAQIFDDFEVIVVDDCSPDATLAVVRAYGDPRVRVVRPERNGGCVHARNLAFSLARGRYIAGLDHDDLCHPDRFARQVAFLDSYPDVVLVGTGSKLFENGEKRAHDRANGMSSDLIDWMMLTRNPLVWSSVMFRADVARKLDPFERPDRHYLEDFDLYHRMRRYGRIAEIPDPLTLYRIVPGSMSQTGTQRMLNGATMLLAERHADLLGLIDRRDTERVVRHVMGRQPVPDAATLRRVFAMIEALHRAHLDRHDPSEEARAEIISDITQLWHRLTRAAVRSGTIPLRDALHAMPIGVPLQRERRRDLIVSGMIGAVRSARRSRNAA